MGCHSAAFSAMRNQSSISIGKTDSPFMGPRLAQPCGIQHKWPSHSYAVTYFGEFMREGIKDGLADQQALKSFVAGACCNQDPTIIAHV